VAIKSDLVTGGELVDMVGPYPMANEDPSLGQGQVRYYVDFSDEFGEITTYSVNYDPGSGRFGVIKVSSGPPRR
jgi:hypothetical protein